MKTLLAVSLVFALGCTTVPLNPNARPEPWVSDEPVLWRSPDHKTVTCQTPDEVAVPDTLNAYWMTGGELKPVTVMQAGGVYEVEAKPVTPCPQPTPCAIVQ